MSYSYSKSSVPSLADTVLDISSRKHRPTGCSSLLVGCLGVLVVICSVFLGGFLYIYSMDKDEALGAIAVSAIKNQSIHLNLTTDFNQNPNIPFDDKLAIRISYDRLLANYDNMPESQQKAIKKNLGVLIKKFINKPDFLKLDEPPEELRALISTLVPNQNFLPDPKSLQVAEDKIWAQIITETEEEIKQAQEKAKKPRRRRYRRRRRYSY